MRGIFNIITKNINRKIIFSLLILISFTSITLLLTTVVKISSNNIKVTKNNLDMLSNSIFQNLRNIMDTGNLELIKKTEDDIRSIQGMENLKIFKSKSLISLYGKDNNTSTDLDILKSFKTKKKQIIEIDDESGHHLRMIKPMLASENCLNCHTNQQIDDVIGVIDLTYSLNDADINLNNIIKNLIITSLILGIITLVIIFFVVKQATLPIIGLKRAFGRLLNSDESYKNLKLQVRSSDEISEVAELFNQYMDKLHDDIAKDAKLFADYILNSQLNIIVSTNKKSNSLQTANKSFLNFFNVKNIEEFQKKYGKCICDTFESDQNDKYIQKAMKNESWYEYIKNRPDQTHKVLIIQDNQKYIFKITTNQFTIEDIDYNASVLTDITELEKVQHELISLNNNLEEKVQEEVLKNREKEKELLKKEKVAALGEMMDAIAHQWKQPLSTIDLQMQNLELDIELGTEITNKDIKVSCDSVHEQITHLVTTIDEFRQFFRPNQLKTTVNINESLKSIEKLMKDVLINNKIKTEIKTDTNLEYELVETEFKHIFINLINNAKDAFIENKIEKREILIDLLEEDDVLKIMITDNAGGIPQDIIQNIFKANVTSKDDGKGTGIGLYLVSQIIEKLNGKIVVENAVYQDNDNQTQKGARFIITLPLI